MRERARHLFGSMEHGGGDGSLGPAELRTTEHKVQQGERRMENTLSVLSWGTAEKSGQATQQRQFGGCRLQKYGAALSRGEGSGNAEGQPHSLHRNLSNAVEELVFRDQDNVLGGERHSVISENDLVPWQVVIVKSPKRTVDVGKHPAGATGLVARLVQNDSG